MRVHPAGPTLPLLAFVGLALAPVAVDAADTDDDWPQYRGPNRRGAAVSQQVFPPSGFGLEVAWTKPLGSGYSGVSVAGERAVTMFAADGHDLVAAFDVATGAELWRHVIAEMYAGHSGSDDGPISTPVIADGAVYGLGPRGDLFALDLDTGAARWQRRLTEDESTVPFYGYTTVPVVAGDLLIVETGGAEGHAVTALDRATGEARWTSGDDGVAYQSPILVELAGRPQLAAVTNRWVLGIDPASGRELWRHEHALEGEDDDGFALPVPVGGDGLMINGWNEVVVLDVRPSSADGGGFVVSERWRSDALKSSYAIPVVLGGYAYGMSRSFLTCVDVTDGSVVWRSRPPGGHGLSLVDGHLALVGRSGELVLAAASPAGYREAARVPVFDRTSYTTPSFAAGRFFVRDLGALAAVRITEGAPARAAGDAEADPDRYLGRFGDFVERVAALPAGKRQAEVDAYFAERSAGPIAEAEGDRGFGHVVVRGAEQDVALSGNLPGAAEELPLHRLDGTDLFYRSFRLDPSGQWQYRLGIDFGDPAADPGNARQMEAGDIEWSVLAMPGARPTPHLDGPPAGARRGRIETLEVAAEEGADPRRIEVYLPPGYDDAPDARYPLVVMLNGQVRAMVRFEDTLDYLIATEALEPVVVAFVPRSSGREYGQDADAFLKLLADRLLPRLEGGFRLAGERARRAIMGIGSGGRMAVYAALNVRGTFGKVATQSFYARGLERVLEIADARGLEAYLELRTDDYTNNGVDADGDTRALADALTAAGATVEVAPIAGGADLPGWRWTQDQVLVALFGREP